MGWEASSNDDVLQMWLGTGPQLDGLGHMGEAGEFYNCNQGKDFSIITGLTKLDINGIPPMVGRGVMIDIAKQMGVDSLQAGQPITSDDIKAAMKSQGVTVGEARLSYCTPAIPMRHSSRTSPCGREVSKVLPTKPQYF